MKLKRLPQEHRREDGCEPLPQRGSHLAQNAQQPSIGYCSFLYHTGRGRRSYLGYSMVSHRWFLLCGGKGIIAVPGIYLYIGAADSHFDLAVSADPFAAVTDCV